VGEGLRTVGPCGPRAGRWSGNLTGLTPEKRRDVDWRVPLQITDLRSAEDKDWRWRFLAVLAETCCVTSACLAAGVSRQLAYDHRKRFPKFRRKWDESIEVAVEQLELSARRRALDKNDPGSTTLTIFLLKAHKPDVYRETVRQEVTGQDGGPVELRYINDWRSLGKSTELPPESSESDATD